jgi:hypothetical protein
MDVLRASVPGKQRLYPVFIRLTDPTGPDAEPSRRITRIASVYAAMLGLKEMQQLR